MLAAPCLLCRYLYSVHLKPLTGVKNFVCATTVASAIGLGAIAMGGGSRSVLAVWRPMVVAGGLIWHRECVMDIKDMEGDGLAGVRTLPVVFGAKRALLLSLAPLLVAATATASASLGAGAAATMALALQGGLALLAMAKGFGGGSLTLAIELAPLWLLAALVALCW